MDTVGTIASLIAAITGIIMIWNSKGNVIKRIERKQAQIQELNNWFARTYGLNDDMRRHYDVLEKREKLKKEIEELRKKI